MEGLDGWFALLAIVLTVAAVASGVVDRSPISYPIIFLGLGLLLGRTGIVRIDIHSPGLEAVATLSLALVLFLDAVRLDVNELRADWRVSALLLGPGTLLTIAGVAIFAHFLFGATLVQSLLLGAVLASTDPIVLRDILRDGRIPRAVRSALRVEAGMNDVIVLPIILALIAIAQQEISGFGSWLLFGARLLALSPAVGLVVGGVGAWVMGRADARYSIRREYQALYGLGLVLLAFVVAQAVGGDGFLAAFFAGLAVAIFDVSLCDCFLEYGEVTAEMTMLLAFLLFGATLAGLLGSIPLLPALALALATIILVRPLTQWLILRGATLSREARLFIGWFGPRGLSSLLLALLVVEANAPDAVPLFTIVGVVVLVSALAHGVTATPLATRYVEFVAHASVTPPEERSSEVAGLFAGEPDEAPRISVEELAQLLASKDPPLVLDVRTRGQYAQDEGQIPGSVRVLPDQIQEWASTAARDRRVVAYCT
jgi:NhaP-type Na+/H+ or K+/H+ antiporter